MSKSVPTGKVTVYPENGYAKHGFLEVDTQCQDHQVWFTTRNAVPIPLSTAQVEDLIVQLSTWVRDSKLVV